MSNVIAIEPYLAEMAKQKLIDSLCDGKAMPKYRAYLNAELSDDPDFWHGVNAMMQKIAEMAEE